MKAITRKFWMPLLVLSALGLGSAMTAQAQPFPPVGTSLTCRQTTPPDDITTGITVVVRGASFSGTSEGTGTFKVTSSDQSGVTYEPTSIDVKSDIRGLGVITTSLGNGSPASSTTSIRPDITFPVTSSMTFVATGNLNGIDYTSVNPVNLVADQANSFNPFKNEPFRLEKEVDFVDKEGNVGFTLTRLDVIFND